MIPDELLQRLDVPGPRYTSYPTVPNWSERFGAADHARALVEAGQARPTAPLSLYVHIPFCRSMCSYCGCNVIVSRDPARADAYLELLDRELELQARLLGERRTLARVHWGGGTPTFLDEAQLERLWRSIAARFRTTRDAEIAVEIDPKVTRASQLETLRALGFNRLSMGVQDFDPDVQQAVRRIQSVEATAALVAEARRLGFRSVGFDLIYGLPRQTEASFRRTLEQVLILRPERLALFSFAYLPKERPNQRRLQQAELPTGRAKLRLFEQAREQLLGAGYRPIGMDHFALPEDELAQALAAGRLWRDFQGYSTRRADETIAVGLSGISDLGYAYAQNVRTPTAYRASIEAGEAGELPTARGLWLSADDRRRREVIVQLMCNGRVDLGLDGARTFAGELDALQPLVRDGLCTLDGATVALTELGRRFPRNVAMVFDAYLRGPTRAAFSRTI